MSIYEIFTLLGGVGLFLYGMTMMSSGLRNACGERLRVILERATRNRLVSVLVGVAVTVLIQSSSATNVMVIGFVSSGMMTLGQAVGVMMGANIGTTVTAQITAFNLSAWAPVILFLGALMYLFVKKQSVKHVGAVIMGFGMLFQGVAMMKATIAPLAETPGFVDFLATLENPLLTVLFGAAFTALLQSSSSSSVIFQAFAVQGILSYRTVAYLLIGSYIGSVTPNLLASLTANREGRRTAVMNLTVNLFQSALLFLLITAAPGYLELIARLSPGDVGRQVANTHTVFAATAVCVLLPMSGAIVKLAERLVPVRAEERRRLCDRGLMYLTQSRNVLPAVALDLARREIVRMGQIANANLRLSLECFFRLEDDKAALVEDTEDTVNYLDRAITEKLVELRSMDMSERELHRLSQMLLVVADIERISDHAENIVEYEAQVKSGRAKLSPTAVEELRRLSELALRSAELCLDIFASDGYDRLPEAEALEQRVDDTTDEIVQNHVKRLMTAACDPQGGVVFTDMSIDLERCSDHAINIAQAVSER